MPGATSNPAKLTEVYTDMEAAMIVAALEEQGIEAHLTGEFTSGFRAEAPGNVKVLVSDSDLANAQQVLRNFGNQEEAESTEEQELSEFTFRKFSRITAIVGLVVMAVMYLGDLVVFFLRLL